MPYGLIHNEAHEDERRTARIMRNSGREESRKTAAGKAKTLGDDDCNCPLLTADP